MPKPSEATPAITAQPAVVAFKAPSAQAREVQKAETAEEAKVRKAKEAYVTFFKAILDKKREDGKTVAQSLNWSGTALGRGISKFRGKGIGEFERLKSIPNPTPRDIEEVVLFITDALTQPYGFRGKEQSISNENKQFLAEFRNATEALPAK